MVPAPFALDVGLGIKQNTTTGQNNRAYQAGQGTSATQRQRGRAQRRAANIKAAQAELEKFAKIEQTIRNVAEGHRAAGQGPVPGHRPRADRRDHRRRRVLRRAPAPTCGPRASACCSRSGRSLAPLPNDIAVEGNANNLAISSAIYPSNWELSGARASAVVRYLIANDSIAPDRLSATGFGSSRPLYPASDPRSVSYNRRVDLVVESQQPAAVRALLAGLGKNLTNLGPGEQMTAQTDQTNRSNSSNERNASWPPR